MRGHRLELAEWADGIVRIAYWNSVSGNDTIIRLTDEGAFVEVWRESVTGDAVGVAEEAVRLHPVDLAQQLRQLHQSIDEEIQAFHE